MQTNRWCPVIKTENRIEKCMQSECAWWDDGNDCCVVFSTNILLEDKLRDIENNLSNIWLSLDN